MRLINADELLEHAYRDKLDSRELIAAMINNAPTIKEIPVNVPLSLVIKALEQEKTGHWIYRKGYVPYKWKCDKCFASSKTDFNYCPNCGCKMSEVEQ